MARPRAKSISLSANWQITFVVATALCWLANVLSVLVPFLGNTFIGAGTWMFQISIWVYPLLYLGLAWCMVARRYPTELQKLFVAFFTTTVFYSLYNGLATAENSLRNQFYPSGPANSDDHSYWTAFGHEWTVMIVGLVVYLLVLIALRRRLAGGRG